MKEIVYKRRTGNGQTFCKGRWGLNWDSMMYDVVGLEFPVCSQCLKELKQNKETIE